MEGMCHMSVSQAMLRSWRPRNSTQTLIKCIWLALGQKQRRNSFRITRGDARERYLGLSRSKMKSRAVGRNDEDWSYVQKCNVDLEDLRAGKVPSVRREATQHLPASYARTRGEAHRS